jgi:electron transport complex protein RnfC
MRKRISVDGINIKSDFLDDSAKIDPQKPPAVYLPDLVYITMSQHIGKPCMPVVKAGDVVRKGQLVGDTEEKLGAPIHASVSGKVIRIEERYHASGKNIPCVIIENDGKDTLDASVDPYGKLRVSPDCAHILRRAGVVGMGGAMFPTTFETAKTY